MTAAPDPTTVSPTRRSWTADVFLAAVGSDVIVLDLRSDAYACLPDLAQAMSLDADGAVAEASLLDALTDLDLLSVPQGPSEPRRAPPVLPSHCLDTGHPRWSFADVLSFARAAVVWSRLGPNPPIKSLIKALPPPSSHRSQRSTAEITRAFQALLPWAPGQGVCLYRAFVLLTMLRLNGLAAAWVFGVRTWPFGAHCWLQCNDAVLDDDPERVAQYIPIMVI